MNYIAIRPSVALPDAVSKHLREHDMIEVQEDSPLGMLVVYESNFQPLWAREHGIELFDLREEILLQEWLSTLPPEDFRMVRVGDPDGECATRGTWVEHPFLTRESVRVIEQEARADVLRQRLEAWLRVS